MVLILCYFAMRNAVHRRRMDTRFSSDRKIDRNNKIIDEKIDKTLMNEDVVQTD